MKATCTITVKTVKIEVICDYDEKNHEVEIISSIGDVHYAIAQNVTLDDMNTELLEQLKP